MMELPGLAAVCHGSSLLQFSKLQISGEIMHGHISLGARWCMDIYLLGQDADWTYTFGGKIKQGYISLEARLCKDIYLWRQDYARVYIFGGKIMREHISIETNAKMLQF